MALRLRSYLAPSVPAALFETLAGYLASALGTRVELTFDSSRSGPRVGEREPFGPGEVDLAFLCATSYVWLTGHPDGAIDLVGACWAPTDPRAAGRAVYFSDVLARRTGVRDLPALAGRRVAYNDDASLSGYHSLRLALSAAGVPIERIDFVRSGSHLASLAALTAGDVDAAAVDSNVWRRCRRATPGLAEELRSIASLGPYPGQPLVARRGLPRRYREGARSALLTAHRIPAVAAAMASAELTRFVAVTDADFAPLRARLSAPTGAPTGAPTTDPPCDPDPLEAAPCGGISPPRSARPASHGAGR